MIWIGIGIGFLWCFFLWLFVGMCRIGSEADARMEQAFRKYMQEQEGCTQGADGVLREGENVDAGR